MEVAQGTDDAKPPRPSVPLGERSTSTSIYPKGLRLHLSSQKGFGILGAPRTGSEVDLYARSISEESVQIKEAEAPAPVETSGPPIIPLDELLDITSVVNDGVSAIVDDSFTKCFQSNPPEPWNWNWYLFPLWCLGVVLRYCILFPLRFLLLLIGFILFFATFFPMHIFLKNSHEIRHSIERKLALFLCGIFVASWTGVIRYHGPRPSRKANQVFVANHTSMIDFIILEQMTPFAVIMQLHSGWVGWMQTRVLSCLGCIWFDRTEVSDRKMVAEKIKKHISDANNNSLLIFPEGTCVNNEYCVMFKKGAFELGATVCPIAIKYNKIFVDAFWNSRKQSFGAHLLRLMTSWAVVCDVWYLEPQTIRPDEKPEEFANRVQALIARRAGIKAVQWDGYLKYYRPSKRHTEERQKELADRLRSFLPEENLGKQAATGTSQPIATRPPLAPSVNDPNVAAPMNGTAAAVAAPAVAAPAAAPQDIRLDDSKAPVGDGTGLVQRKSKIAGDSASAAAAAS